MSITQFFKAPQKDSLEYNVKAVFENPPTLETERLILTKVLPEHATDMHEYYSDDDVTRYLIRPTHKTFKETERYINLLQKKYKSGVFNDWGLIFKENGKFIGTCGFTSFDFQNNSAEIGYVLAKDYWGKGLAVEAAKRVIQFGVEELGIQSFCAKCINGNDASLRVMQKCGLIFEGIQKGSMFVKGQYRDVAVCRADAKTIMDKINNQTTSKG